MDTNEFDLLLKEKFEKNDFAYKPEGWQQMASRLSAANDVVKPSRTIAVPWRLISGIAASAAVVVGMYMAFFSDSAEKTSAPSMAHTTIADNKSKNEPAVIKTQEVTSSAVSETVPSGSSTSNIPAIARVSPGPSLMTAGTAAAARSASSVNDIIGGNTSPAAVPASEPVIAVTEQPVITREPLQETPVTARTGMSYNNGMNIDLSKDFPEPADDTYPSSVKNSGRTSLALTGGVNYGVQNTTGYMVGVNARRNLGGKFYLEGGVAVVNNSIQKGSGSNATPTVGSNPTSGISGTSAMVAMAPVPSPQAAAMVADGSSGASKKNDNNLQSVYYIQVMPAVGYHLVDKVSVSLGADMQHLLDQSATESAGTATPGVDVGMTGKVEYSFSRKVKAGMMYREGVNSMLDSKYSNRSYMQVQFSWALFGK